MGYAVDRDFALLTDDGLRQHEFADLQPVDVNVQIRQDRGIGIGRRGVELRAARQHHQRGFQQADRNMVVHITKRLPHDMHARGHREHALGVAQHKIVNHHVAIDRPVDPSDFDGHARFEFQRRDLLDQESLARLGVEAQQQARHQHDQRHDKADDPDRDLLPQGATFAHDHGLARDGLGGGVILSH